MCLLPIRVLTLDLISVCRDLVMGTASVVIRVLCMTVRVSGRAVFRLIVVVSASSLDLSTFAVGRTVAMCGPLMASALAPLNVIRAI